MGQSRRAQRGTGEVRPTGGSRIAGGLFLVRRSVRGLLGFSLPNALPHHHLHQEGRLHPLTLGAPPSALPVVPFH